MAKLSDINARDRLLKLFNKNLGSDFKKADKNTKTEQPITNGALLANGTSAQSKYRHLADKAGVKDTPIYSAAGLNINQRAERRKKMGQARQQHNIETIMGLALEYCSDTATTDDVDPDWFNHFIALAEEIHSPLMQDLWGKILAGEITRPGTFSFKSISTLKQMTNKEAIAFQHACNLSTLNKQDGGNIIIYGCYTQPRFYEVFTKQGHSALNLSKYGLPYPEILTLMDIELIYRSEIESGVFNSGDSVDYSYLGQNFRLTARRHGITVNYFKLTQTGNELIKLLRLSSHGQYLSELKNILSKAFSVD